jgi:hypothetical protein
MKVRLKSSPRTCKYLNGVHRQRRMALSVDLDNGHAVPVDGENEVRVTRDRHQPKTVAVELFKVSKKPGSPRDL